MSKAKGLSLEIEVEDTKKFGPFDHHSHLDGIDFNSEYMNNTNYKLIFTNEGDYNIQLAIVFEEDLETSLKFINQNFTNFQFPISNYKSTKFTYFYSSGLIFHEKKYSKAFFIGVPIALALIFITVTILGIPAVFERFRCC